ncbi:MAG: SulP family inorganic anion transporter [Chloroflexota bacterium]
MTAASDPATSRRLPRWLAPTIRGYRRTWLTDDARAALILWTLLVPQALAYAQIAGMPPETGLYTALGAMAGYALLGASRHMNVGPEATVGLLSASVLAPIAANDPSRFLVLSAALAIMTGVMCLVLGLLRLGFLARLLSRPVLVGYLAGTGVTMIGSQLDKLLGLDLDAYDAPTIVGRLIDAWPDANLASLAVGVAVIASIVALRRWAPAIPAYLVAIVGATAVTALLSLDTAQGVAVVGSFPSGLPAIGMPRVGVEVLGELLVPAIGIAFLSFADSGITARALARRTHDHVDQDQHMLGMGAAGIAAGLAQGFAVNGSASRSFAVVEAGGRSQLAGVMGIGLVALTLLVLAPLFASMPLAALGAVTIVVAVGLIDLRELARIGRFERMDLALALATAAFVIWVGMLAGILLVILLSLLDVARRSAVPNTAVLERVRGTDTYRRADPDTTEGVDQRVAVYRFDAPLFFANVEVFAEEVERLATLGGRRAVLVNAEAITSMDSTAAQALDELLDVLEGKGVTLAFARVKAPLRAALDRAGITDRLGADHLYLEVDDGVDDLLGSSGSGDGARVSGALESDPTR